MFKSKTVFILGAGSSFEAGFPLGSSLTEIISEKLKFTFPPYQSYSTTGDSLIVDAIKHRAQIEGGNQLAVEREVLNRILTAAAKVARGMSQALSIDNYLEAHADDPDIVLCGKLAIARAILLAEKDSLFRVDKQHPDTLNHDLVANTWYGKLFQLLVTSVPKTSLESLFQNISFVTFNYDRSFERYLPMAIENYYHCGLERAYELVRKVKIFHPYGICGNLPWQRSPSVPYGGSDYCPELLEVAEKIQTFSEQVTDESSLKMMRDEVATANNLAFLGFGFHEMNMKLLTVPKSLASRVFGTAHGLSASDVTVVQKRISQAMGGKALTFDLKNDLKCVNLFDEFRFSLVA